ncbi:uncharacterized protein NPIL_556131 [Nephila pilipes]|uniref:Uncharacterized protein n=1 Tax=Nephila pilipes TaxID=299642 RepID=A0A8X6QA85_NEPPI|nr:uncharacterized protein NPIL_556131 [Nephila pilipes]
MDFLQKSGIVLNWFFRDSSHRTYDFVKEVIIQEVQTLRKIHAYCTMTKAVPKSKAARVLESFPATADNYPKAVAQLQERFGREDLLVQIYVRDLLSMVMKNAATGRSKTDLPA